jgi:tetratricopeptide (TPR) repeat protein
MRVPSWRSLALDPGVLAEPAPGDGALVLWLAGRRAGRFRHWERLRAPPRADVRPARGLCAAAATLLPARQRLRGWLGRVGRPFRRAAADGGWVLPTGEPAEPSGPPQAGLLLVWPEDGAAELDEARVRARWPDSPRVQRLGPSLFLVAGDEAAEAGGEAEALPPAGCPRQEALGLLAAARAAGDRGREAAALADLALIHLHEGDPARAAGLLEQALPLAVQAGDPAPEGDVRGELGWALLLAGQPRRALELLEQRRAAAVAAGDRLAEKVALERLGLAHARLGDPAAALPLLGQALALARAAGDRQQEAQLLWALAIAHADRGERPQAITHAEAAVALLQARGQPQAAWFAQHLRAYRDGGTLSPGLAAAAGGFLGAGADVVPAGGLPGGPGLLRRAFSAAKAMAAFLGSGLRTVGPAACRARLRACAACAHHTGLRCRVCGCFTTAKARLAHEDCPLGRWPAP